MFFKKWKLSLTAISSEFSEKSSLFQKGFANQNVIDVRLFKKTRRSLKCSPKTLKVIREIQEKLFCVGKRKEQITKKTDSKCRCSKAGLALKAKHITCWCKKVSGEINARQDIVVNIIFNKILVQRGMVANEQKWDERNLVNAVRDEITVGTEHRMSDEWRGKC